MKLKHASNEIHPETELLTVPETAALFKVKVSTIRSWVLKKRLPYVKVFGKCIRFRRADMDKLITGRVVAAQPEGRA